MRLIRFGPVREERPGILIDETNAYDLSDVVDDFDPGFFASDGIARIRSAVSEGGLEAVSLEGVRLGPPIVRPPSILCIGLNFRDHAEESGAVIPDEPIVFGKKTNTLVGPNDDVLVPRGADRVDFEVELALVIGKEARYLESPKDAEEVIAGYAVSHDVSERSFQLGRPGGQWIKGKSCETFNPLGPWLVTPDEIGDLADMSMMLWVNEELMQNGTTADMVFDPQFLVWHLSQFMVLEPGDLINTGTPAGVGLGRTPPRYLVPGDVVGVEISGLGRQRQVCRSAP